MVWKLGSPVTTRQKLVTVTLQFVTYSLLMSLSVSHHYNQQCHSNICHLLLCFLLQSSHDSLFSHVDKGSEITLVLENTFV